GGDHAEVVALRQAGEAARGATLYVTLEPCCHYGRTPPCTDAVIAAGVAEVSLALEDPSPWVAGRGRAALEAAGIRVRCGERAAEARRLNEGYFKWVTTGLPFVTAKYAMTLDGKTATHTGSSRWISGELARERVGRMRSQADAVVVGVGTVLADDPQLTARDAAGALLPRQPARVVLDSQARTPPSARLLAPGSGRRTLVVTTAEAEPARVRALEAAGAEVVAVAPAGEHVDPRAAFAELARRQITSVLVESGGRLLAALVEARLVDRVAAFIAPKLVGGAHAPGPVQGEGVAEMSQALVLSEASYERVGDDLLVMGYLGTCSPD
ncbi:MAG: bifunctional diaminohydroxyphosphoribosylaminopyrimidine deaminase/5-amino-6-(5-phosphoribosylamino)uracil reductase RibD, partial [Chloroflexi bacterium]|nr:bifunctional diaminohydroxyphosphoribosylaminopyrimidine deaminase/5-amino-6-(5-phosphoribosylamino)uracil reductase RibD [Chloroflexota bacterium]